MMEQMPENNENYQKVIQIDGIRTTVCLNRFEVVCMPHGEIFEQKMVQALKDWVRWRKAIEDAFEPLDSKKQDGDN